VTIQDLQADAQDFLSYYINGATAPRAQLGFPGSNFAGIQFRAPAVLDIRPEYTPVPSGLEGTLVSAGSDGPEGVGPYLLLDRCPLRAAVVTIAQGAIDVELVCVVQYPAATFPDPTVDPTIEVRLPSNGFNLIAAECLSKLEDCIGGDADVGFPVGYSITVLSLSEFNRIHG
jgi:hypothetical protein